MIVVRAEVSEEVNRATKGNCGVGWGIHIELLPGDWPAGSIAEPGKVMLVLRM